MQMTFTTLRRTAAAAAALSGVLHLLMLGHGGLVMSLTMAAMAMVCLPCAGHLWRGESLRAWVLIGAMNAGMLIVHLWLIRPYGAAPAEPAVPASPGHHHGGGIGLAGLHEPLMHAALGIAAAEVLLALTAAACHLRDRPRGLRLEAEVRSCPRGLQAESRVSPWT